MKIGTSDKKPLKSNYVLPLSTAMQRIFQPKKAKADNQQDERQLALQDTLAVLLLASLGLPTKKGDLSTCLNTSMITPLRPGAPVEDNEKQHNTVPGRIRPSHLGNRHYYQLDSKQESKALQKANQNIKVLRQSRKKAQKKIKRLKTAKELLTVKNKVFRKSIKLSGTTMKICSKHINTIGLEPVRKGKRSRGTEQSGDNRHFNTKALYMQARFKVVSDINAAKIKPALDVVTENIAILPYKESWASPRTVLRAVQTLHRAELITLREHLQKAKQITYR